MSNGYTNVTFLTNLAEHSEVKKLLNGTIPKPTTSKDKVLKTDAKHLSEIYSKSPEAIVTKPTTITATATVNVAPSTSLLLSPVASTVFETKVRNTNSQSTGDGNTFLNCKLCDNKIMCSRLSNLTNHVRRHSSVKQYSCVYCPYQHNEMSKVRTHMAGQHGDTLTSPNDNLTPELQKIWCAYMEKCFPGYLDSQGKSGRNALEVFGGRSLARLEGTPGCMPDEEVVTLADKLHNCVECGDAVSGESDADEPFMVHIRLKHAEACTPYQCGECGYLAAYEYTVRGHIATEHAQIAADVTVTLQPSCDNYSLFVGKFFPSLEEVGPDISEELQAFVDTANKDEHFLDKLDSATSSDAVSAEQLLIFSSDSGNENAEPSGEYGRIDCRICSAGFSTNEIEKMMAHSKDHYCIKQFECPFCSYASNVFQEVKLHLAVTHEEFGAVIDQNNDLMQQAWMQTMKKCFPDLVKNDSAPEVRQEPTSRKRTRKSK